MRQEEGAMDDKLITMQFLSAARAYVRRHAGEGNHASRDGGHTELTLNSACRR